MRGINFVTGFYQAIIGWETLDFGWAILTTAWEQDESTQIYMDDITAFEFTDVSYSRQAVTGKSVVLTLPPLPNSRGNIGYLSDAPDFGAIFGGEVAGALVLYNDVTNDGDSPIVACVPINYTADGSVATFAVSISGTLSIPTSC